MKKRLCLMFAAVLSISAFAVGKGTDSTGEYWEDASGVKHYYLFQISCPSAATRWSLANNAYSREHAQNGTVDTGWVANSIYALDKDTTYYVWYNCNPVTVMYGFELEALCGRVLRFEGGSAKYTIGEYGIHSVSGNTIQFMRGSEGEEIYLAASQTWSGPAAAELSAAPFVIVPNYAYQAAYRGYVSAVDDITLTVEGDTVVPWLVYDHPLTNMDVVIRHPAIVSLPQGSYGTGNLYARKVTIDGGSGIRFGADTSFIPTTGSDNNQAGGAKTYGIGSFPAISPMRVAETIVLTNGATLTALATTTVSGGVTVVSAGTTANAFSGTFELKDDETEIQVLAGATLDLTAATFTGTGIFSVVGEGVVKMSVKMDSDGYCELDDWMAKHLSGFEGSVELTVSEGTLVLENAASIPSNCSIVTANDGAVLVVDDTGFDAATQLGGTKAVAAPARLVVTDAEVTGEVTVNNGETLRIFGSGLGENASLTLWGGATVMFRRTATLSAPTWHTNSVYYKTFDASVTGTVASVLSVTRGAVSASGNTTTTLNIDAPGLLNFSGSGQLRAFSMNTGHAAVTGEYDVYGEQNFYGGHMTVRDGGHIRIQNGWQYIRLDRNASRDACLEIATGGTFEKVAGNCYTYVGRDGGSYESKLLVSGGTYLHKYDSFILYSGGVVEVTAGMFQTKRRIECHSSATPETAKVILRGGKYYVNGSITYAPTLFYGAGACNVIIDGNVTLQYDGIAKMADSTSEVPTATWSCTEGSRLKVVGQNANGCELSLRNFEADGLIFDLNTSDYNNKPIAVRIVDPKDPIGIGFVLPGKAGSKIVASNAVPALVASYVVPAGQTFDATALPSGWYEGFGDVSVSNIIFETGSTFRFPFFGDAAPLAISGQLTLPDAMNYSIVQSGQKTTVTESPVIVPALGTVEAEGGSTFTCTGGVRPSGATLSVADDALAFSYKVTGATITIR